MYSTNVIGHLKKNLNAAKAFSVTMFGFEIKIMDKCVCGNQACAVCKLLCKLLCNHFTIVKTKMHCKNKNIGERNIFFTNILKTPFTSVT